MRVKGGVTGSRRHKRTLKAAKGFRGRRKNCFRLAKLAVQRSRRYATRDRKVKKREFRGLWILRINAAARLNGLTYGRLIHGMNKANISIDRKILAEMAVHDRAAFNAVVDRARAALA